MAEIKYISGMKMGYFIENFLKKNNKYNPKNYKDCYEYCKVNCNHITNGKPVKQPDICISKQMSKSMYQNGTTNTLYKK